MTDLVSAAAQELEDLRSASSSASGAASGLGTVPLRRSASLSPPSSPPCVEQASTASLSESSSSESEEAPGRSAVAASSSSSASTSAPSLIDDGRRRTYRRSNTTGGAADYPSASAAAANNSSGGCPGHPFPPSCLRLVRTLPGNSRCVDCGEMNPEWGAVSYGALLCLRCSGRHRGLGVNNSVVRSIAMDNWSHSQVLSMLEGGNDQLTGFFNRHSLTPTTSPRSGAAATAAVAAGSGGNTDSSEPMDSDVALATAAALAAQAAEAQKSGVSPRKVRSSSSSNSSSASTGPGGLPRRSSDLNSNVTDIVARRYKTKAALFYRQSLAKHVLEVASHGAYKGREAARKRATAGSGSRSSQSRSSGDRAGSRNSTKTGSPSGRDTGHPTLPISPSAEERKSKAQKKVG